MTPAPGRPSGDGPPLARFKVVCPDAVDPHDLGDLRARILPAGLVDLRDGDTRVDGRTALRDAGTALLRRPDDDIDWWILAGPEGNEFCASAPQR